MRHLVLVITLGLCPSLALGQVTYERILNADKEPGNWLTYSGQLQLAPLLASDRDHAGQRRVPPSRLGLSDGRRRLARNVADRHRWHHVHHSTARHGPCSRRAYGADALELVAADAREAPDARLSTDESRRRHPRRDALLRDARQPRRCARCELRPPATWVGRTYGGACSRTARSAMRICRGPTSGARPSPAATSRERASTARLLFRRPGWLWRLVRSAVPWTAPDQTGVPLSNEQRASVSWSGQLPRPDGGGPVGR